MAGLDMTGHIDSVFESVAATRTSYTGGGFVNGLWVEGTSSTTPHTVTIQPATDKEIDAIEKGGERIVDARRVYVNDDEIALAKISQADVWAFLGEKWKCHKIDNRPWRTYCKLIVARFDVQ
jgi:hypothetical protein